MKILERLVEGRAPGPYPSFSVVHLIRALELIAKKGPIGRGRLSEELKTGEGTTRTLIDRLKSAELVAVSKLGCSLTKEGERVWQEFQSIFPQKVRLEKNELTLGVCNVAMLVKDCGNRVGAGVKQRDAAIIAGARGATTLLFKDQKMVVPMISENVAQDFPVTFNQIIGLIELEENDVIVIGSADSWIKAEYGALAAAWTLVENNSS